MNLAKAADLHEISELCTSFSCSNQAFLTETLEVQFYNVFWPFSYLNEFGELQQEVSLPQSFSR